MQARDIAGLIGISGPYDFLPLRDPTLIDIFGGANRPATQPISFTEGRKPPALLVTGDADSVVNPGNSIRLADRLRRNSNEATEVTYRRAWPYDDPCRFRAVAVELSSAVEGRPGVCHARSSGCSAAGVRLRRSRSVMSLAQFATAFIGIVIGLSLVMSLAWAIEQRTGNSGWIDTVWTFGVGILSPSSARLSPLGSEPALYAPRQWLVAIARRGLGAPPWAAYCRPNRGYFGRSALRRLCASVGVPGASWQMWLLVQKQAIAEYSAGAGCFSRGSQSCAGRAPSELSLRPAGLYFWLLQARCLADQQLRRFRPCLIGKRGAICEVGMWRWSRHPNYFFEWFGWLGYPLVAIHLSGGYGAGWLALPCASPACTGSSSYVSGIPPLEEHMLKTRGAPFRPLSGPY